jgi:hypothetical protein
MIPTVSCKLTHASTTEALCKPRAPGYFWSLAFTILDLVCRSGVARAEPGPNEIFDLLSWVLIVPLGIFQIAAAVWVRRQIGLAIVPR